MTKKLFTKANAKIMGKKGGRARSQAKIIANKLNGLARSKSPIAPLMRLAKSTDPLESFEHFLEHVVKQEERIKKVKNVQKQFSMTDKLISRLLEFHRLKFGDFQKNINLGMQVDMEEIRRRIIDNSDLIFREVREDVLKAHEMDKYDKDLEWVQNHYKKKKEKN